MARRGLLFQIACKLNTSNNAVKVASNTYMPSLASALKRTVDVARGTQEDLRAKAASVESEMSQPSKRSGTQMVFLHRVPDFLKGGPFDANGSPCDDHVSIKSLMTSQNNISSPFLQSKLPYCSETISLALHQLIGYHGGDRKGQRCWLS